LIKNFVNHYISFRIFMINLQKTTADQLFSFI
jgi:hypothetical protein